MADSVRERIMQAIAAALGADGAPASVKRTRIDALEDTDLPCMVLLCGSESVTEGDSDCLQRTLLISVCCLVSNADETLAIDALADPMLVWANEKLCSDRTLGGLTEDLQERGTSWILQPDFATGTDHLGARADYEIVYYTSLSDQTLTGQE